MIRCEGPSDGRDALRRGRRHRHATHLRASGVEFVAPLDVEIISGRAMSHLLLHCSTNVRIIVGKNNPVARFFLPSPSQRPQQVYDGCFGRRRGCLCRVVCCEKRGVCWINFV